MKNEADYLRGRIARLETKRVEAEAEHAKRMESLAGTIDTLKRAQGECELHAQDHASSGNGALINLVGKILDEMRADLESLKTPHPRNEAYRSVRDRVKSEHPDLDLRGLKFAVTRILKERGFKFQAELESEPA